MTNKMAKMLFDHAPILVTGTHRSGTTWVGKTLALSPFTYYLGELFNTSDQLIGARFFNHHFAYISEYDSHPQLEQELGRVFRYDFSWFDRLGDSGWRERRLLAYRLSRRIVGFPRPIMKDPIAVLSSPWLARRFGMRVIVLVRHPAAFVHSLVRAQWPASFQPFLRQKALMDDRLGHYADWVRHPPSEYVERAALLWTVIYHIVTCFLNENPAWYACRLERIARDPVHEFRSIFDYLGLPFTQFVQDSIVKSSHPANPKSGMLHETRRDSIGSQNLWRTRLSAKEVLAIRRITEPVSHVYYSDLDWYSDLAPIEGGVNRDE